MPSIPKSQLRRVTFRGTEYLVVPAQKDGVAIPEATVENGKVLVNPGFLVSPDHVEENGDPTYEYAILRLLGVEPRFRVSDNEGVYELGVNGEGIHAPITELKDVAQMSEVA